PHLQDSVPLLGDPHEVAGFVERGGDWLLDEYVDTGLEEPGSDGAVKRRRHHDTRTIDETVDLTGVGECPATEARRRLAGALAVDVDHADEIDLRLGDVFLGVEPAEVADTDDGYARFHDERSRRPSSLTPRTAIPARSALASTSSRSSRIVRSASRASTRAFTSLIVSIVRGPMAGTSKRRS